MSSLVFWFLWDRRGQKDYRPLRQDRDGKGNALRLEAGRFLPFGLPPLRHQLVEYRHDVPTIAIAQDPRDAASRAKERSRPVDYQRSRSCLIAGVAFIVFSGLIFLIASGSRTSSSSMFQRSGFGQTVPSLSLQFFAVKLNRRFFHRVLAGAAFTVIVIFNVSSSSFQRHHRASGDVAHIHIRRRCPPPARFPEGQ